MPSRDPDETCSRQQNLYAAAETPAQMRHATNLAKGAPDII